jgi:hypothetical protein
MRDNIGLYRGKRKDNGEWVEGYYVYDESGQTTEKPTAYIYHLHTHPCGWNLIQYEVIPESVSEFSGLTDKNGEKVFEGDIVGLGTIRTFEVKFNNGGFYMDGTALPFKHINKFYKLGNIHDNPELLKGGVDNG